ncbi:fumarylacetoacetate hydrolase family protein [Brachybacterium kimchii]|uniref:Fumarylacetoacetate hydrolase family protein n=1 Tax=Brachybacterium kimchii TaxID=2942909 RepID=A0ABY4N328_9MICO|nr:fumarylacetoacetate hydrolase family protein [Brachybacterium kimchii]UQN28971.1 fumarylacetoacetate hydrolase family protein [Brachybacterium kimchii]
MKFFAHGSAGAESLAVEAGGTTYDLSPLTGDAHAVTRDFLENGGIARAARAIADGSLPALDTPVDAPTPQNRVEEARCGAPLAPGKILCIGLNYRDHAAETNAEIPPEPIVFMKAPDTVVGPYDDVLIPRDSVKTDWEVELGVVIGSTLRCASSPEEALAAIAGYTISNDVSEREFQIERGGTWDKGKNCETFNPMGPYLVTADEIADVQDLSLTLSVNGQVRQDGTTADQIFGVGEVLAYLSRFMTLYPGDLVNTGTPAGVAMGLPGQPYLRDGDVVELAIEGLGSQRQTFRDAPAPTAPAPASGAASATTEKETGR